MASDGEVDSTGRLNGRAPLPFKVRAASKEAQPHKAANVLDPDPKNHWSTSTNAKEWILLELEEPCLLQQIRIVNKSVIEWEISLGLRYKPESFMKVRTRCEASRRDSQYITNYAPCRYVRISCLRGNPIAIYSVQLLGIPMPGLEPEFQNLVEHLLPQLTSSKQETQDLYLQLLRDIMSRLAPFAPYLETELNANGEDIESVLRFLAVLSGPFYPILMAIDERERMKNLPTAELDPSKGNQTSLFTVSSNFQAPPRRSRSPVSSQQLGGNLLAFRPDVVLLFMKVAYRENDLGVVCRMVAKLFYSIATPVILMESKSSAIEADNDEMASVDSSVLNLPQNDYSSLFGEEFHFEDIVGDSRISSLLDISSVEEGLLHFLYACVAKPLLCRRLAEVKPDMLPVLPFVQAILPALRPPNINLIDQPDEGFSAWQSPLVQRALSQVVLLMTTPLYKPLLDGCAGYLSSFSLAHERAACVIIDLCSGLLSSCLPMVVAKIDLAIELVEGILAVIQVINRGTARARAAVIYLMIGLSGHMDEFLAMYKDVKQKLIFIIEILEPYLKPAISPIKNMIAFGDVSTVVTEKQEYFCSLALEILKAAISKPTILPALETEWRKGNVKPSVLLSILAPQLPLPPDIDSQKVTAEMVDESTVMSAHQLSGVIPFPSPAEEEAANKSELASIDNLEDPNSLFIPIELKIMDWKILSTSTADTHDFGQVESELRNIGEKKDVPPETSTSDTQMNEHLINLHIDYLLLSNFEERELRAAEFVHLATELHSQGGAFDNHQAAIDTMLLAVECYLNPLFMFQSLEYNEILHRARKSDSRIEQRLNLRKDILKQTAHSSLFSLEEDRDKAVLQILLRAAEWDRAAMEKTYEGLQTSDSFFGSSNFAFGDSGISVDAMIDATTIVRKEQSLLWRFLISYMQKEHNNINEGLLQGLLFMLCSSTELSCPPEQVVGIILRVARQLNVSLLSVQKHTNTVLRSLSLQRLWVLLGRLTDAASGAESAGEVDEFGTSETVYFKELVPAAAWISKIAEFSSSSFPIVRFIGWKGLASFAKTQQKTGIFLASDLHQLSLLLSVFADDLMSSGISQMNGPGLPSDYHSYELTQEDQTDINMNHAREQFSSGDVSHFLYPELDQVCPSLRKEFSANASALLGAICYQLKGAPTSAIPDILSWFSEICCHPYFQEKEKSSQCSMMAKGFSAANIRFVILKLLEIILVEHMEAIVPELPRVIDVVLSLCDSAYCDIFLLDSMLKALKPVISYGVGSLASVENQIDEYGILTFESLCFSALMEKLQQGPVSKNEETSRGAFLLFLAGTVLSDLSVQKRLQLMQLIINWAKFTSYCELPCYYNYLYAFQKVFESYHWLLKKCMTQVGLSLEKVAVRLKGSTEDVNSKKAMSDSAVTSEPTETELSIKETLLTDKEPHDTTKFVENEGYGVPLEKTECILFSNSYDLQEFGKCMDGLLSALGPALEAAWKMHPYLSSKITKSAAYCVLAWSLLSYGLSMSCSSMQNNVQQIGDFYQIGMQGIGQTVESHRAALDLFCNVILRLQQSNCWQVGSSMMDFLFTQSLSSDIFEVVPSLSLVLQFQCTHAPRVAWRQYTTKWLSKLMTTISIESDVSAAPMSGLFKILLEHKEPEQRMAALQQLHKLAMVKDPRRGDICSGREDVEKKTFISEIVTATWDGVSSVAAWDPCASIRRQAVEVLIDFVPLAQSQYLQRLLSSADVFLPGLAKMSYTMSDASVTRMSLALLSRVCLYSTTEDINMIPSRVWSSLELLSKQKPGNVLAEAEQAVCLALLQLRKKGEDAKQGISEALSNCNRQSQEATNIAGIRESVLQVFARINAIRIIEDTQLAQELKVSKDLREAEIELELVKHEKSIEGKSRSEHTLRENTLRSTPDSITSIGMTGHERLKELRSQIRSEDYSNMQAEILARRERQRLAQRERQLALEGSTIREIELLRELDREKAAEAEREIERHQILERERAKTRELRHTLDLESEKRTQRELQRELEQRESGTVRPSRREFTGSASGRPRERYRERESGRSTQDSRSATGVIRENSTTPPATPTAGSRPPGR